MTQKFCEDCKHLKYLKDFDYNAYCMHPSAPKDIVYGVSTLTCYDVRDDNKLCNTQAIWFEPKLPTQAQ